MIRRLLALLRRRDLDAEFDRYRQRRTGLPGEAVGLARRNSAIQIPYGADVVQIGPRTLSGEALGGSRAASLSRGGESLSPVLTRPGGSA